MRKILHVIDTVNERAGSISSWLVAALIAVILYEVIARYVFNAPTTWGFNTLRMLGGAIVVLGWVYAQRHNSHIRVDVFYVRFSPRKKALIDVIGTGVFFFPLFGAFIVLASSSVWQTLLGIVTVSYQVNLPTNLLYKIIIFMGFCLFFLQFVARFIRDVYILAKGRPL
jgi:TRAP-type mannitol/chloroaromatic compound transport system permease small subunit